MTVTDIGLAQRTVLDYTSSGDGVAEHPHAAFERLTVHRQLVKGTVFYTAIDARHFVGAVGLINSLRLSGHDQPIVVTDIGMTEPQRRAMEAAAEILDGGDTAHGVLAKPFGPLTHPAEVMVVLDADVLVLRSLDSLIDESRTGKLVFFENDDPTRFFTEWSAMGAPFRRLRYVIAGHYLGPGRQLIDLLTRQVAFQETLDHRATHFGGGEESDPYYYADQDILNALLMTMVAPEIQVRIDRELSPVWPFTGVVCRGGLECVTHDGRVPFLLHHILRKPWLASLGPNPYVEVLRYVLHHPDAPIALDPTILPLRLRDSRLYKLDRARASCQATLSRTFRGRLGIRRRLAQRKLARNG